MYFPIIFILFLFLNPTNCTILTYPESSTTYANDISSWSNTGGATFSTDSSATYCPSSTPCWHIVGPGPLTIYPITRTFTLTSKKDIHVKFDMFVRDYNSNEYVEFGWRCDGGSWLGNYNYLSTGGYNLNADTRWLNECYKIGDNCDSLEIRFNLYMSGSGDHWYLNNLQIYYDNDINPTSTIVTTDTVTSNAGWLETQGTAGFINYVTNNANCLNGESCIEISSVDSGVQTLKFDKTYSDAVNYLSATLRFRVKLVISTEHKQTGSTLLYRYSCNGGTSYGDYDGLWQITRPTNEQDITWSNVRIDLGNKCNLKIEFIAYVVGGSDKIYLDHFQFIGDTASPTEVPTSNSKIPTSVTNVPTTIPTINPTKNTIIPSKVTSIPSKQTKLPTIMPTGNPTVIPTKNPSISPVIKPADAPASIIDQVGGILGVSLIVGFLVFCIVFLVVCIIFRARHKEKMIELKIKEMQTMSMRDMALASQRNLDQMQLRSISGGSDLIAQTNSFNNVQTMDIAPGSENTLKMKAELAQKAANDAENAYKKAIEMQNTNTNINSGENKLNNNVVQPSNVYGNAGNDNNDDETESDDDENNGNDDIPPPPAQKQYSNQPYMNNNNNQYNNNQFQYNNNQQQFNNYPQQQQYNNQYNNNFQNNVPNNAQNNDEDEEEEDDNLEDENEDGTDEEEDENEYEDDEEPNQVQQQPNYAQYQQQYQQQYYGNPSQMNISQVNMYQPPQSQMNMYGAPGGAPGGPPPPQMQNNGSQISQMNMYAPPGGVPGPPPQIQNNSSQISQISQINMYQNMQQPSSQINMYNGPPHNMYGGPQIPPMQQQYGNQLNANDADDDDGAQLPDSANEDEYEDDDEEEYEEEYEDDDNF